MENGGINGKDCVGIGLVSNFDTGNSIN